MKKIAIIGAAILIGLGIAFFVGFRERANRVESLSTPSHEIVKPPARRSEMPPAEAKTPEVVQTKSTIKPVVKGLFSNKYDLQFIKATSDYMPGVDWKLLKAQCYQESRFDPRAVSPVGAMGVCQFMPGTWKDQEKALGLVGENPFNADRNIQFAGRYMGILRKTWSSKRPETDRHNLAMASYNGGAGNILKAQKLCGGPPLYEDIIACLPRVTGKTNSKETITYVIKIREFHRQLVVGH